MVGRLPTVRSTEGLGGWVFFACYILFLGWGELRVTVRASLNREAVWGFGVLRCSGMCYYTQFLGESAPISFYSQAAIKARTLSLFCFLFVS